jgi:hypothetical protein
MSIDSLFKGVKPSLYNRHPNGKYDALVTGLVKSQTQAGKPIVKIELVTSEGKAPDVMIFLVTDADAALAAKDESFRDKLIKSVQFNKGLIVKLGLATDDEATQFGQNEMLKAFLKLKDKHVEIKIEDDQRDPKYQRVNIEKIVTATSQPQQQKPISSDDLFASLSTQSIDIIPF